MRLLGEMKWMDPKNFVVVGGAVGLFLLLRYVAWRMVFGPSVAINGATFVGGTLFEGPDGKKQFEWEVTLASPDSTVAAGGQSILTLHGEFLRREGYDLEAGRGMIEGKALGTEPALCILHCRGQRLVSRFAELTVENNLRIVRFLDDAEVDSQVRQLLAPNLRALSNS